MSLRISWPTPIRPSVFWPLTHLEVYCWRPTGKGTTSTYSGCTRRLAAPNRAPSITCTHCTAATRRAKCRTLPSRPTRAGWPSQHCEGPRTYSPSALTADRLECARTRRSASSTASAASTAALGWMTPRHRAAAAPFQSALRPARSDPLPTSRHHFSLSPIRAYHPIRTRSSSARCCSSAQRWLLSIRPHSTTIHDRAVVIHRAVAKKPWWCGLRAASRRPEVSPPVQSTRWGPTMSVPRPATVSVDARPSRSMLCRATARWSSTAWSRASPPGSRVRRRPIRAPSMSTLCPAPSGSSTDRPNRSIWLRLSQLMFSRWLQPALNPRPMRKRARSRPHRPPLPVSRPTTLMICKTRGSLRYFILLIDFKDISIHFKTHQLPNSSWPCLP